MHSPRSRIPWTIIGPGLALIGFLHGCEELNPIGSGKGGDAATAEGGGGGAADSGVGSSGDASMSPCECTGPRPLAPNEQCTDGSLAGPVCTIHGDGSCSWEIRSCPSDGCPAYGCNPMCPNGVRNDERGCPTCECAPEPPNPCAGLGCGDGCSTCEASGPCLGIMQTCDAKGTCVNGLATCPPAVGLHWYATCGSPVCRVEPPNPTLPSCGSKQVGDSCTEQDATCDPGVGCGVKLSCAPEPIDTTRCPISSRRYKTDIDYLTPPDLESLAQRLQSIKLATYHYTQQAPAEQKHLGFIIEDDRGSPAVFTHRDRVDLYGYASMAVATLQVQERRIQALERELSELRARQSAAAGAAMCGDPEP